MNGLKFRKKNIIKTIGEIYDLLDLIAPFVFQAKILLKDIWKKKLDWDDGLSRDLAKLFKDLSEELFYLKQTSVPKHILLIKMTEEFTDC